MLPIGEAHEPLGGPDRRIKPLPEGDRNDAIELAVQHKVGTVIAPIRASERNWSFIRRLTGISG